MTIFDSVWVPTDTQKIAVYGEWCGQGIQKGVAISELPKMFVVFGLKAINAEGEGQWLDLVMYDDFTRPEQRIFNIMDFEHWVISIDFEKPEVFQNKMVKITEAVETEARLEQGLDNLVREQLLPFEMSSMGNFIRWVISDIMKEEQDTIVLNQFEIKKLNPLISKVCREWYIQKFNQVG